MAYLYYAEALHANGNYDAAIENYKKFLEFEPSSQRGQRGLKSVESAKKWTENPTRHKVIPMYYFNSRESDYGVAYARDNYQGVFFTSGNDKSSGGKINPVTGQYYSDIFTSVIDRKGNWSKPEPIDGEVNTDYEEERCVQMPKQIQCGLHQ